ncbi:MAG: MtnX-like HAD-IB family phosphatase [Chlorobi bacterium]|nr:MtnX-like HAD-IB family phosphatase [Chlorobiota bacterium]
MQLSYSDIMLNRNPINLFIDFDGTISSTDIGDTFLDEFVVREPLHSQLLKGDINVKEFWNSLVSQLIKPITSEALTSFLENISIDSGFALLIELCKKNNIGIIIVSDGLDIYIKKFLELNGINSIPFFANNAEISIDGKLKVSFPRGSESCSCFPALCKRNVLLEFTESDSIVIYVGDGHSDMCAAEHSDIIFAKKHLAKFCNEKRLPHYPFKNLTQVTFQLNNLIIKNKLRNRHKAQLMRNGAYIQE